MPTILKARNPSPTHDLPPYFYKTLNKATWFQGYQSTFDNNIGNIGFIFQFPYSHNFWELYHLFKETAIASVIFPGQINIEEEPLLLLSFLFTWHLFTMLISPSGQGFLIMSCVYWETHSKNAQGMGDTSKKNSEGFFKQLHFTFH